MFDRFANFLADIIDAAINKKRLKEDGRKKGFLRGAGSLVGKTMLLVVVLAALFGVFYSTDETEWAVVTRFGKVIKTDSEAGLKMKFPFVDRVKKLPKQIQVMPFGYRPTGKGDEYETLQDESTMITGDENIVGFDLELQYVVVDPVKVLYSVDNPELALKSALSAAVRSSVGSASIDDVLTDKKSEIASEISEQLKEILDKTDIGIQIRMVNLQDADLSYNAEVDSAFKRVTNAREERVKKINEAEKIRKNKVNNANGEAAALIDKAEAFKLERVNQAKGDVALFNAIYAEYAKNKTVTMDRLRLEAIKKTLSRVNLYVVEKGGTINYLPLLEAQKQQPSIQQQDVQEQPKENKK